MNALVNPGAITATSMVKGDPLQATDIYTRQCSVGVNTKDLAVMAATLANGGRNPVASSQLVTSVSRALLDQRPELSGPSSTAQTPLRQMVYPLARCGSTCRQTLPGA